MEFADPACLFALAVPAGWLAWRYARPAPALGHPDLDFFAGFPAGRARVAAVGSVALRVLALTAAAVASAGPRTPDLKTRVETPGVAIVLALDVSGSMDAPTFAWQPGETVSRREAARRAFHLFVAGGDGPNGVRFAGRSTERGTDAVGLVTFANWPQPLCPPTVNYSVLLKILDEARPPSVVDTGTNVGDAIAEAVIRLENVPAAPRRSSSSATASTTSTCRSGSAGR